MVSLRVMVRAKDWTPLLLTKSIESMKAALPSAKPFLCIPLPTGSPPPIHCLIQLCEVDFIDLWPMRELILGSENLLQGPGLSKQQKWDMSPAPQEPCSQLQCCASHLPWGPHPRRHSEKRPRSAFSVAPPPLKNPGTIPAPGSPVTSHPCSPAWLNQEEEIPLS